MAAVLLASYVVGLAWLLSLAFVDGDVGIARVLANRSNTSDGARGHRRPACCDGSSTASPSPRRTTGRPTSPGTRRGALLFFVGLVRIGLGGDFAAGAGRHRVAATTALAVLVDRCARLGAERSPAGPRRSWC